MLWLRVRVGESVYVGDSKLTLVEKNKLGVTVELDQRLYTIGRNKSRQFATFSLHAGNAGKGLRLGFDAPQNVDIWRV